MWILSKNQAKSRVHPSVGQVWKSWKELEKNLKLEKLEHKLEKTWKKLEKNWKLG